MKSIEFTEAESKTSASKEIRSTLRKAGYKLLGSGADATVWAKKSGPVTKIIMPDDHQGAGSAGDTFMKFYEFCLENQNISNLPRFSGNEASVFQADGKDYIMVTMERLKPIPEGSFEEAMVWQLSDLATKRMTWKQALEIVRDPNEWMTFDHNSQIIDRINSMSKKDILEYEVLFKLMTLLYHKGKINKVGWDLHTENAMMRDDGTIVITDPWFSLVV